MPLVFSMLFSSGVAAAEENVVDIESPPLTTC
jgi:hypothetical protein